MTLSSIQSGPKSRRAPDPPCLSGNCCQLQVATPKPNAAV
ncbi:hypothetical protein A1F99_050500 [Pyrenophora tritici-repentis]|nr:hypothetical protein A1F99_050500 [Pyrenophora tritici-repentis]